VKLITPEIVIFHCAATPDFKEGELCFDKFGVEDVERWHKEKGFLEVGYHFVVKRSGVIQSGRRCAAGEVEIGAHCHGENARSIGVCYIGSKEPSQKQRLSIPALCHAIEKMFGITKNNWFCHNHFNNKKLCPGFGPEELQKLICGDPQP
jgi:N-acetylmuramoyl-L-alanine amidase